MLTGRAMVKYLNALLGISCFAHLLIFILRKKRNSPAALCVPYFLQLLIFFNNTPLAII
jgi:hypothetical protein